MSDTNHKYRYPGDAHDRASDSARYEDDPLVELARIVSGGSYYPDPEPEPEPDEPAAEEFGAEADPEPESRDEARGDEAYRDDPYASPDAPDDEPYVADSRYDVEAPAPADDRYPSDYADDGALTADTEDRYDPFVDDRDDGGVFPFETEDTVEAGEPVAAEAATDEPDSDEDPLAALERELFAELHTSLEPSFENDVAEEPQTRELKFVPVWGNDAEPSEGIDPAAGLSFDDAADEPEAFAGVEFEPASDEPGAAEAPQEIADYASFDDEDASQEATAETAPAADDEDTAEPVAESATIEAIRHQSFAVDDLGEAVTYHEEPPAHYSVTTKDLYQRIRASGFAHDDAAEATVEEKAPAEASFAEAPKTDAEPAADMAESAPVEPVVDDASRQAASAPVVLPIDDPDDPIARFDLSAYSAAYAMTAPVAKPAGAAAPAVAATAAFTAGAAVAATAAVADEPEQPDVAADLAETVAPDAPAVEEPVGDPEDLLEELLANELASEMFERAEPAVGAVPVADIPFDDARIEGAITANFDDDGEPYAPVADRAAAARSEDDFSFEAPVDLDELYGRGADDDAYAYDEAAIAEAADEARPVFSDERSLPGHDDEEVAATPAGEASRRGMWAAAAVGAIVIVGIGGFLGYRLFSSPEQSGPPPVIQASTDPVKERPTTDGTEGPDQRNKLIYDRVGADTGEERLIVPGEEKVVPLNGEGAEPRVVGAEEADPAAPATGQGIPRRVRTVVVRPDGTIISGEPEADATEPVVQAVDTADIRPTTSEVETAAADTGVDPLAGDAAPSDDPASVFPPEKPGEQTADAAAPATDAADTLSAPALPPVAPSENERKVATRTVTATPTEVAAPAPVPADRPTETRTVAVAPVRSTPTEVRSPAVDAEPRIRPVSPTVPRTGNGQPMSLFPAATPQQPAANTTTAAAPAATQTGDYVVQVTSQRTEDQARIAYQALQRRYSSLLTDKNPNIERADLGDKGTYYRVRVGPMGRDAANDFCSNLKSRGGECFVRRK